MLPPIRFLEVTGRYNEPLLYRSNAEPAKLESGFFAASVDLGKSGRYILQSQRKVGSLQKRDIKWIRVIPLANTHRRRKLRLLCASRQFLQLRKLLPSCGPP